MDAFERILARSQDLISAIESGSEASRLDAIKSLKQASAQFERDTRPFEKAVLLALRAVLTCKKEFFSASVAALAEEIAFYKANNVAPAPVAPIDIGPTITPAEWAAHNPRSLLDVLSQIVHICDDGANPEVLDGAVEQLREVLLNESDEQLLGEKALAEAGQALVRAYKGHKMFGDDLSPALDGIKAVLYPKPDPQAEEPYLYILMRNDLASMNAGKAVAQGTHAANQMVYEARQKATDTVPNAETDELEALLDSWETAAHGFGTCIVLTVTEAEMRQAVASAKDDGVHAGITHDPSYPLWDGKTLHLIPLDTCGYVFARKFEAKPYVGRFSLMP